MIWGVYIRLSIPLWSDFIADVDGYCTKYDANKDFQSHYGLILSVRGEGWDNLNLATFQSHYGLILSALILTILSPLLPLIFQSHYGLILSADESKIIEELRSPFNPTMVWFYRIKTKGFRSEERGKSSAFNPTMVWFYRLQRIPRNFRNSLSIPLWSDFIENEDGQRLTAADFPMTFQSHYGLILSRLDIIRLSLACMFFQSHYGLILSWILIKMWKK